MRPAPNGADRPFANSPGWDVSDPAVVLPEYQTGGKADYALLASEGKPSVVIEAKHLDEPLASHRMQMVNYANVSGIPYAGLTDGNHWEVYKVFDQAPIEERLILNLSINSSTPAHEAALKLLLLWRPNLSTGQPVVANPPVLVTTSDLLPGDLIPPAPAPNPGPTGNWISLSVVDAGKGNSPPTEIRFSGREPQSVNFWWQVLVEVADELASNGMLKAADCPIAGWASLAPRTPRTNATRQYQVGSTSTLTGGQTTLLNTAVGYSRTLMLTQPLLHCASNKLYGTLAFAPCYPVPCIATNPSAPIRRNLPQ